MTKLFRLRDRTEAIAKALRGRLEPGERILAGVKVQTPGTRAAGAAGGGAAATASALSVGMTIPDAGSGKHRMWQEQAGRFGIDARLAGKSVWLYLALTNERLILVRRSYLTGRPDETLAAWPVRAIDSLAVPRNGSSATIKVGGEALRLELPKSQKFLPDVYRELPARWEAARAGTPPIE